MAGIATDGLNKQQKKLFRRKGTNFEKINKHEHLENKYLPFQVH